MISHQWYLLAVPASPPEGLGRLFDGEQALELDLRWLQSAQAGSI